MHVYIIICMYLCLFLDTYCVHIYIMSTTSIMTVGIDVTYSIPLGPSGCRTKLPLPQEPTAPANLQGALKKKQILPCI